MSSEAFVAQTVCLKIAGIPPKHGLFDPVFEKDSCGVGMVTDQKGRPSHQILQQALQILRNLKHRGAEGFDPLTGDGAGVLTQVPHDFLRRAAGEHGIKLPASGEYAVGMVFLPPSIQEQATLERLLEILAAELKLEVLGWRRLPVASDKIGPTRAPPNRVSSRSSSRSAARARPRPSTRRRSSASCICCAGGWKTACASASCRAGEHFYVSSLSTTTIVYKGLLLPEQIDAYYLDLRETDYVTAIALVHSRFSTNTFPAWRLAHPYRYLCHNGEINTLKVQHQLDALTAEPPAVGAFRQRTEPTSSPSCRGPERLGLPGQRARVPGAGRALPGAVDDDAIPEPWAANPQMDLERRGFYEYQSAMMEPWDGPAAVCFTDGK